MYIPGYFVEVLQDLVEHVLFHDDHLMDPEVLLYRQSCIIFRDIYPRIVLAFFSNYHHIVDISTSHCPHMTPILFSDYPSMII
jgi:hypothetical protein